MEDRAYDRLKKEWNGGVERDRTADLLVANEALSQLSYNPTPGSKPHTAEPFQL
jgi:hypothetical protein